ncbi:hypothetical protein COB80_01155 [Candidatus Kaiserbacteria bacterium]|nr:MAG: hypothetical protein COB80_01155 [Candidatus Kaiserbacteria bacterium]
MYVLYFFLLGLFLVWVPLRLLVPNLWFGKNLIPQDIPYELEEVILKYNKEAATNEEFLGLAYGYVTEKYYGSRLKTITEFWRAFGDILVKSPGFLPCTGQNYLLRTMLIKSNRFKEEDIKIKTVPLNLFIHQYIKVRVDDRYIDVDPWSNFLGVPIGKKSFLFG